MTTDLLNGGAEWKLPRRFHLLRNVAVSGVSGVSIVAEGAMWSSGTVALHWPGNPRATSIWTNIHDVLVFHGNGGETEVVWLDDENVSELPTRALEQPPQPDRDSRGWPVLNGRECKP